VIASQKKHTVIVKDVPSSTRSKSEMEPRGTVITFAYDKFAWAGKTSGWVGIGIRMFGGDFGRYAITCEGNDGGS